MEEDKKCLIGVSTFRRPQFLPRMLACFDRLDYSNKKMVIINDDSETIYKYEGSSNIEVINIDKHLPLAVKRNLFTSWDFDVYFPLDDDDLFLPERIKNHMREYLDDPTLDLFRNRSCYMVNDFSIKKSLASSFSNCSFTRTGYFKSGGYTNYHQSNQDDICLRQNFRKNCKVKISENLNCVDFVYQFDGGRYHNTNNSSELMPPQMIQRTINQRIKTGEILIEPDYETYDNINNLCSVVNEIGEIKVKKTEDCVNFELVIDK